MKYFSVCSGIEAATVAAKPLGWKCVGVAEIERFPSAVIKHHHPEITNYGDITKYKEWTLDPFDVLIGGTPCQSFSVAGLRKGMDDPRGNLAFAFLGIAKRFAPRWVIFENVPGLLSIDGGRAFGSLLGGLADIGYGFAYTVLDSQYFNLAQRRERVFLVGHIGGNWQRAAAVLFDAESMSGNPAPRRQKGQGATYDIAPCIGASGRGFERTGNTRGQDCLVAHTLRGRGFDASEDGTGRGTPLIAATLRSGGGDNSHQKHNCNAVIPINMQAAAKNGKKSPNMLGVGKAGDPAFTVNASDRHAVGVPVPDVAWALQERDSKGSDSSTKDGHLIPVIAFPANLSSTQCVKAENLSTALGAKNPTAVAFERRMVRTTGGQPQEELSHCLRSDTNTGDGAPCVARGMAVRRLTPIECERLQGFPDNYTRIPWRGKPAEQCPDGPRYKALGNSFSTPVVNWICRRIQQLEPA